MALDACASTRTPTMHILRHSLLSGGPAAYYEYYSVRGGSTVGIAPEINLQVLARQHGTRTCPNNLACCFFLPFLFQLRLPSLVEIHMVDSRSTTMSMGESEYTYSSTIAIFRSAARMLLAIASPTWTAACPPQRQPHSETSRRHRDSPLSAQYCQMPDDWAMARMPLVAPRRSRVLAVCHWHGFGMVSAVSGWIPALVHNDLVYE